MERFLYPSGEEPKESICEKGSKSWKVISWTFCHIHADQWELLLLL